MAANYTVTFDANGGATPVPATLVLPENSLAYGTLAATARAGHVFQGWFTGAEGGTLVTAETGPVPNMDHTLYARWAAAVTVTFAAMGGSAPDPAASVVYGVPCVYGELPATARAGYHFTGWFDIDGGRADPGDAVPAANVTLYARWHVTVTFDANGGGGLSDTALDFDMPGRYGALPSASRAGYAKTGWWTAAAGGTRIAASSDVAVGDHTLYAQWAAVTVPGPTPEFVLTPDGGWVRFDPDVLAGNLPAGLQAAFSAWLTGAERVGRLAVWANGVARDFRGAVDAANHEVGQTDGALLPLPCLRHAQMMVWYFVGLECGYAEVAGLRRGWQEAEVYLRGLYASLRGGTCRFAETGAGIPRYAAKSGGASATSGDGTGLTGVISYGI